VSDGGAYGELESAQQIGMHAVQILVSDGNDNELYREDWNGSKISSLKEVLELVK